MYVHTFCTAQLRKRKNKADCCKERSVSGKPFGNPSTYLRQSCLQLLLLMTLGCRESDWPHDELGIFRDSSAQWFGARNITGAPLQPGAISGEPWEFSPPPAELSSKLPSICTVINLVGVFTLLILQGGLDTSTSHLLIFPFPPRKALLCLSFCRDLTMLQGAQRQRIPH